MKRLFAWLLTLCMVLTLLPATALFAAAIADDPGSAEHPYEIHNAQDWADFAANVNAGTNADKHYRLANDFDNSTAVTATVGTETHPFAGVFDGNGKTLNVSLNDTSNQGAAPFRNIQGATVKNLTVSGTVTGTTHAAGLVGFSRGGATTPNLIENCVVNTAVSVPATGGNRHMGGVVGHGTNSYLTIKDTVFAGTMNNTGNYAGGLMGWSDGNNLTIENSFFVGSYVGSASNGFHPIAIHNRDSKTIFTDNGAYYTANPTLTDAGYIAGAGSKVVREADKLSYGDYTALPAADGNTYYLLSGLTLHDAAGWNTFAALVNGGNTFAGCTVRLADDFDNESTPVTTMAGTSDAVSFQGRFFGNGKTLYVALSSAGEYCAPFLYVKNATFNMLKVAGSIAANSYKYAGGLIGRAYGEIQVISCVSSVAITSTINGDGTHGGFIGTVDNGTTAFDYCLFDGSISGSSTTCCGGFVGWHGGGSVVSVENCLMSGDLSGLNVTNDSATFSRNGVTPVNSYYRTAYGAVQGNAVGELTDAELAQTLGRWYVDTNAAGEKVLPIMDAKDLGAATVSGVEPLYLYTGSPIATPSVVVTAADGTVLVENTDYTLTWPIDMQEVGECTLTVTGIGDYTGSQVLHFVISEGIPVTADTTEFLDGFAYKVFENITNDHRIEVRGAAILILGENTTLTLNKGIYVDDGKSLTIRGDGALVARANDYQAAIGGNNSSRVGAVTIESGTVTATGGSGAAGIGGGRYSGNGANNLILISGGTVTATGGADAAGIGGGFNNNWRGTYGSFGDVTITGGVVTAHGSSHASGIGGGSSTSGIAGNVGNTGRITITGGQVTATSPDGYGIGPAKYNGGPLTGAFEGIVLGWTAETDFIDFTKIASADKITFVEGKSFVYTGGNTVAAATTSNIQAGGRLTPLLASTAEDLANTAVAGVDASYNYTGTVYNLTPVLTDIAGNVLTEGTHYTTVLTLDGEPVSEVLEPGAYVYTFTAVDGSGYNGERICRFTVIAPVAPSGLAMTAYSAASAKLTWTENGIATNWTLEYSTDKNFNSVTGTKDVSGMPELTLNLPEGDYYARVKAVVDTYVSDWSNVARFSVTPKTWIGFTGTTKHDNLPFNNYYKYALTQQIYTAAEVGSAGAITRIDFLKTDSIPSNRTLDVYFVLTTKTEFSSYTDWFSVTEADRVFSGTVQFANEAWTTITLDRPFNYDGTSNLVLIVDDNTGSYKATSSFATFSSNGNASLHFISDSSNQDPTAPSAEGVRTTQKNIIRLTKTNGYVASHSVTLGDEIGVNYYLRLPQGVQDPRAILTWGEGIAAQTRTAALTSYQSATVPTANYRTDVSVGAKQMTDWVTLTVTDGDKTVLTDKYCVADYAFQAARAFSEDATLKQLLCDMLAYGGAAQTFFNYRTNDLASAKINKIDAAWTADEAPARLVNPTSIPSNTVLEDYGLRFEYATLMATSKTAIRLYFSVTDENAFNGVSVSCENSTSAVDQPTAAIKSKGALKYVELGGISAKNIFDEYSVTLTKGDSAVTFTYSAADYYNRVKASTDASFTNLQALMGAMYNYSQSAAEFANEN